MTRPVPEGEAVEIARRLTKAEAAALTPFNTFSDATGASLKAKGLLAEKDGVWTHTPLGSQVRAVRNILQGEQE